MLILFIRLWGENMPISVGTDAISAAYVGTNLVDKIYLGSSELWTKTTPRLLPDWFPELQQDYDTLFSAVQYASPYYVDACWRDPRGGNNEYNLYRIFFDSEVNLTCFCSYNNSYNWNVQAPTTATYAAVYYLQYYANGNPSLNSPSLDDRRAQTGRIFYNKSQSYVDSTKMALVKRTLNVTNWTGDNINLVQRIGF